jgi:hypothetical protein
MPSSLKHEVILVHYPFTDLSATKVGQQSSFMLRTLMQITSSSH